MNQQAIFTPFFAMMWQTFVVWVYMHSRRIPCIARSRLGADQLVPLDLARQSPELAAARVFFSHDGQLVLDQRVRNYGDLTSHKAALPGKTWKV